MADGRVARLDGIDVGDAEVVRAPVARLDELPAAEPGRERSGPAPAGPVDLGRVRAAAPAAPVADLAAPGGAQRDSTAGAAGPVALFDVPSVSAGRDDVTVVELGPAALDGRAIRGGRRRPRGAGEPGGGTRPGARRRGRSRSDGPGPDGAAPDGPVPGEAGHDGAATGPEVEEPHRRPRGRRGRAPEELDPDADPVAVAREVCLRLLTERARTRQELATALRRKGVPDDAAHTVLERFDEVGLIDDAAFAEQWVRSRHAYRGLARRALAVELRRKGVSDEDAQEALAGVDAEAEERRARELVDRKLRSLAVGTAEQRAAAGRRLVGMLARKGYGAGTAYRVVKEALAERGAEVDELGDGELPDD